jgi:adenylate cyclase
LPTAASAEGFSFAQNFFRQAIDLDPTFAPGYGALALAQLQAAAVYQKLTLNEAQRSAEGLARRAMHRMIR